MISSCMRSASWLAAPQPALGTRPFFGPPRLSETLLATESRISLCPRGPAPPAPSIASVSLTSSCALTSELTNLVCSGSTGSKPILCSSLSCQNCSTLTCIPFLVPFSPIIQWPTALKTPEMIDLVPCIALLESRFEFWMRKSTSLRCHSSTVSKSS